MADANSDIAKMSFEAALQELETIIDRLEKGNVALEESIKLYARGESLKKQCAQLLDNARMRVDAIVEGADGKAKGATPLDPG